MWYNTDTLEVGVSGNALLQIRDGKAFLVGVHTDGADDKATPPYKIGDNTAGVVNWSRFY